jgi:hypothetical protein
MLTTKIEDKQKWRIVDENLKQEVALVNLPTMWQPLQSLVTMEHAHEEGWRRKKGRLEDC